MKIVFLVAYIMPMYNAVLAYSAEHDNEWLFRAGLDKVVDFYCFKVMWITTLRRMFLDVYSYFVTKFID